jgi:hypothetical protein
MDGAPSGGADTRPRADRSARSLILRRPAPEDARQATPACTQRRHEATARGVSCA